MDSARARAVELDLGLAMAEISPRHELFSVPFRATPGLAGKAREFHCAFFFLSAAAAFYSSEKKKKKQWRHPTVAF